MTRHPSNATPDGGDGSSPTHHGKGAGPSQDEAATAKRNAIGYTIATAIMYPIAGILRFMLPGLSQADAPGGIFSWGFIAQASLVISIILSSSAVYWWWRYWRSRKS